MSLTLSPVVTVDLHGRNLYQAKVAADAALRRAGSGVYRIRFIHGHHAGTAIRDMLRNEYASAPGVLRITAVSDGITEFVLKEL